MGFTCSAQECETNQANHLVADLNLPMTTLDKNYPSLTAFIAQVFPSPPPPTQSPRHLHKILPNPPPNQPTHSWPTLPEK